MDTRKRIKWWFTIPPHPPFVLDLVLPHCRQRCRLFLHSFSCPLDIPPPLFSQNGYSHFFCNKKNCDVAKFLLFHVHAREKEKKMLSVCFYLVWLSPSPTLFMCVYEQVRRGWPHPPSDQYSFLLFSLSASAVHFYFLSPNFRERWQKSGGGGGDQSDGA